LPRSTKVDRPRSLLAVDLVERFNEFVIFRVMVVEKRLGSVVGVNEVAHKRSA
jgi:D-alanine-D-alanine ligase-like ATP-grasp enzyme